MRPVVLVRSAAAVGGAVRRVAAGTNAVTTTAVTTTAMTAAAMITVTRGATPPARPGTPAQAAVAVPAQAATVLIPAVHPCPLPVRTTPHRFPQARCHCTRGSSS